MIPLEVIYPTRRVWPIADEAVDTLPLSATLQEAIAIWEEAYFQAGGKPGKAHRLIPKRP